METGGVILVAHRGGESIGDGDPVEGVRRLVAAGVEMVEFDVRRTSDGVLVVHHDATVNGEPLVLRTYAEHIAAGARLATLAAFLEAADGRIALDVELKEPGYEQAVVSAVLKRAEPDKVVVTSFHDTAVAAMRKYAPGVATGLLVGRRQGLRTPLYVLLDAFPFGRLERCGADFLAPSYWLLRTGLSRRARRHGVRLLVWTVDDLRQLTRLGADPQVIGVVTDSAQALLNSIAVRSGIGGSQSTRWIQTA